MSQDNTRVYRPLYIAPIKRIYPIKVKLDKIYDLDKSNFYKNMLEFYNLNAFGYGIQGTPTNIDYTTTEGLNLIQSNFDNSRNNAFNFLSNIALGSISLGSLRINNFLIKNYMKLKDSALLSPLKSFSEYLKNIIGQGAEATVVNDSPITVGKITSIPVEEMNIRNNIPNAVKSIYVGEVKDGEISLPTYVLLKLRTITEEKFPKYILKLDKAMLKSGFRRVNDPNVQYRAYTNNNVVIDDISPDNIGLDLLGRPKMFDFNILTVPEWLEQGFTLNRRGGKLYGR